MYKTYENYRFYRERLGLSDYAVSKLANVTTSTLSDWKTGKHHPNYKSIEKIAKALDINPDALYSDIPKDDSVSSDNTFRSGEKAQMSGTETFMRQAITMVFMQNYDLTSTLTQEEFDELKSAVEIYIESWIKAKKKLK